MEVISGRGRNFLYLMIFSKKIIAGKGVENNND
jgi:hypothetical protein